MPKKRDRIASVALFVLLLVMTISCTSQEELARQAPIFRDTINRSERYLAFEPEVQFRRSSSVEALIDTTKLVYIETNDSTLLANIDDIEYYNDIIYILDLRLDQVVALDTLGRSIFSIQDSGRSRREYLDLKGMEINGEHDEIYLLDGNGGKVLVYNLMGRYQRAIMLPCRGVRRFAFVGDGKFALEFGCRGGVALGDGLKANLIVYDSDKEEIVAKHFVYKDDDIVHYPYANTMFASYADKNYFWPVVSNSIYEIEANGDVYRAIELDFDGHEMPYSMFREPPRKYYAKFRKEEYSQVERFIEFDDFYYISINTQYVQYHHFYNKKSLNSLKFASRHSYGDFPRVLQSRMFKINDDVMCSYMTAETYLRYNKLDTIVKIDHNPILFLYQLRDTLEW